MVNKRYVTINTSISEDGLGIPTVSIYFSYCDKKEKCLLCHNPELQNDGVGFLLSLNEILEIIEKKYNQMKKMLGRCEIALIGGEPLAEINRNFAQEIGKKYKTILYTWRKIEDLSDINITMFDRIVCGEYIDTMKDEKYLLGSTNQYIINGNKEVILKYNKTGDDENCT